MARRIEHRSEFGFPAASVHAALTDEAYLRERLGRIGGRTSELLSHTVNGDTVRAVMRQGIDAEFLPSTVRRIAPNGVQIERTETWTGHRGTVDATVSGMPGSLRGTLTLTGTTAGSELVLNGEVKVSIPLVGGKVEAVIAEQLGQLMTAESRFTTRWLTDRA